MSFYTLGNKDLQEILLKLCFGLVETNILHKRKAYERKVVFCEMKIFIRKEHFIIQVTTDAKYLPMSFQT